MPPVSRSTSSLFSAKSESDIANKFQITAVLNSGHDVLCRHHEAMTNLSPVWTRFHPKFKSSALRANYKQKGRYPSLATQSGIVSPLTFVP